MPLFYHSGALGDFILALPFLRALRVLYRDASWTAALPEAHAELVGRIFLFARRIGPGDLELAPITARPLDPARLVALAQRYGGLFGFARRAHEIEAAARTLLPDVAIALAEPFAAAVTGGDSIEEVLADVIARAGGGTAALGPAGFAIRPDELPPLPPSVDPLRFLALGPGERERVALLHPGAADRAKQAPMDYYIEIARGLEARGWRVGWVRGPVEREREAAERVRPPPGPLLDSPGLVLLAHAIARAGLYVGNDSGPTHLASALGTPVIAIHSRPNPAWRPRAVHARTVAGSGAFPDPAEVVAYAP